MVVPLALEGDDRVHTAGNDLFITHEGGRAYGSMELRFQGKEVCETNNLKRRLRLGIFDEALREGSDIDSGLALSRAGRAMIFEPASVASYRHLERKWNIDVGGPRGHFKQYLVRVNSRVGPLTQLYPSRATMFLDRVMRAVATRVPGPAAAHRRFTAWRTGYYRE
jgi:hypothetical protein